MILKTQDRDCLLSKLIKQLQNGKAPKSLGGNMLSALKNISENKSLQIKNTHFHKTS